MNVKEKALAHAAILSNRFEMDPHWGSNILDGKLHYSVAIHGHGGVCAEIERGGESHFAELVAGFEMCENAYVYHAILTGPFLSLLFVSEKEHEDLMEPSPLHDQVGAVVFDLDKRTMEFGNISLARYEDALVRID